MKFYLVLLSLSLTMVHGQIVCPWSHFEYNGRHWFAPNDNPWTFTYPSRIVNADAWKLVDDEQANMPNASIVSRTVNIPSGHSGGFPTYTATASTVARLQPGSGYIDFVFTNLPPSTIELRIVGCSTNEILAQYEHNGWTTTNAPSVDSVRRPLIFKWVCQEEGVATNTYRQFGFYETDNVWMMAKLSFSALRYPGASNVVTARLSLDPDSLVSADVFLFWLYANNDFSDATLHKTLPTTYSPDEYAFRTNYAATTADSPYAGWRGGTPAIPAVSSTSISNAYHSLWPGINYQSHENVPFAVSSNWVMHPLHAQNYVYWYEPFVMTNYTFGESFGQLEYNAGIAPLPWLWNPTATNWLAGWGKYGFMSGQVYSPIAMHIGGLINGDTPNGSANAAPAERWHYFPSQTNAAHLAAAALAKLAIVWPSLTFETHITELADNDSPYLGYNLSSQTPRRAGKFHYENAMAAQVEAILQTLDYLWPYISTNAVLATNLTEFIPYLNNDTNLVRRHFERFLFDSMEREYWEYISICNPFMLGLTMQTGEKSAGLMDASLASVSITPYGGGGAKHNYGSSLSSFGPHRVGSLFYETASNFGDTYFTFLLYRNGGGVAPYDLADLSLYPKIAAFAEWISRLNTAAGFPPSRGDASRLISEGRNLYGASPGYQDLWRILNAAGSSERFRMAKYVNDIAGRGNLNASEWASVQSQASLTSTDIRYPDESRVLDGLAMLERGLETTNHANRGSVIVATDVGYGHDHSDHLDLNIFMHGARLLSDFGTRNEQSNVMYPASYSPQVHNVIEVDGYSHPNTSSTEGHNSRNFLFSTGAVAKVVGSWAWSDGTPPYNHFSRVVSMVDLDATNSYVVSVQRVDAGTWDVSFGAGTTAGGPTNLFTSSMSFSPLDVADNIGDDTFRPAFKLRKHGWKGDYWPAQATTAPSGKEWFQWHLSTASGSAIITNLDSNGGTVSWADASAAMGVTDNTYLKLHLFDRTNDVVCFADAFSDAYNFVSRRIYSMPARTTTNGLPNASQVWLECWEPFVGSAYITNTESIEVAGTTTNYTGQKALKVQGDGWEDLHLSEAVGSNRVTTLGTFTTDGLYALYRSTNGGFRGMKVIGGSATNGNYKLTVATNRIAGTVSAVSYTNNTFTASNWPSNGVQKTGWYRFWNDAHETEYYVTNFLGTTVKWQHDALIGTTAVTNTFASGNLLTNYAQSLPVLAYPKRWTGLSFANEAYTINFQGNCSNAPTRITRTGGDTPVAADFEDLDGDGWVEARIYDFGNTDTFEVPAEATLQTASTNYTLSANVTVTVTVPDGGFSQLYLDNNPLTTTIGSGTLTATIDAWRLTGSDQTLSLGSSYVRPIPARRASPSLRRIGL